MQLLLHLLLLLQHLVQSLKVLNLTLDLRGQSGLLAMKIELLALFGVVSQGQSSLQGKLSALPGHPEVVLLFGTGFLGAVFLLSLIHI